MIFKLKIIKLFFYDVCLVFYSFVTSSSVSLKYNFQPVSGKISFPRRTDGWNILRVPMEWFSKLNIRYSLPMYHVLVLTKPSVIYIMATCFVCLGVVHCRLLKT